MRSWWSAFVLVALVVVGAGLAQTRQGHVLLSDAGLYKVPTSYTELAFTAPDSIPDQLKSQRVPLGLSFWIHNASGSPRNYRWSIVTMRAGKSHVEATGVASTPGQGRVTVARTVVLACVGGRIQVVVRLAAPAESIDFWATCPPRVRSRNERG